VAAAERGGLVRPGAEPKAASVPVGPHQLTVDQVDREIRAPGRLGVIPEVCQPKSANAAPPTEPRR
jgi:hypothetical protein